MNHLFLLMKNSVNGGRYWMTKSSFSLGVRPFKRSVQNADCRLQTADCRLQTADRVQNAD